MASAVIDPENGYQREHTFTILRPTSEILTRHLITNVERGVSKLAAQYGGKRMGTDRHDVMDVEFPGYPNAVALGQTAELLPFMSLTFPDMHTNMGGKVTVSFDLPAIAARYLSNGSVVQ